MLNDLELRRSRTILSLILPFLAQVIRTDDRLSVMFSLRQGNLPKVKVFLLRGGAHVSAVLKRFSWNTHLYDLGAAYLARFGREGVTPTVYLDDISAAITESLLEPVEMPRLFAAIADGLLVYAPNGNLSQELRMYIDPKILFIVRGPRQNNEASLMMRLFPFHTFITADQMPGMYLPNERGALIYQHDLWAASHEWCLMRSRQLMQEEHLMIAVGNTFARLRDLVPFVKLARSFGYLYQIVLLELNQLEPDPAPVDDFRDSSYTWESYSPEALAAIELEWPS